MAKIDEGLCENNVVAAFYECTARDEAKPASPDGGKQDSDRTGKSEGRAGSTGNAGECILHAVRVHLARFISYPSPEALDAHVLWIAHAHLMEAWHSTPRLAFLSPEPQSGKSRALEVTQTLVPRPLAVVNATPAYLVRKVAGMPTILFDEVDATFGPKAREHEDLRALLNAGHRRGAFVGRCVVRGKTVETEELPAYAAVALAGLGNLPDTISSRSIIVRMRPRTADEIIEPYRARIHEPQGHDIRERLAAWCEEQAERLASSMPKMPEGVTDRAADVWEPLIAVADAAGGDWPNRARVSAVSLVSFVSGDEPSLGLRLLADLKSIFGDAERLPTAQILRALCASEEAPWGDLNGKPLDSRQLARRLRPYGIKPRQFRIDGNGIKGYEKADLADAWARYLRPLHPESETAETSETIGKCETQESEQ